MDMVFFGSADFGIPALHRLFQKHTVRAVVSTPPKPQGRGLKLIESPIAEFSRRQGAAAIFTPVDLCEPDFREAVARCKAEIFVVIAFRVLPRALFSLPPSGTINVHASLLPKYRGPAPIQRAVEAGEKETGITIFRIDEGVDTGGILFQKRLPIGPQETSEELYARLGDCGAEALLETLDGLKNGKLRPCPQNNAAACRAPKLSKDEAHINWRTPAVAIYNKIRAFKPFPGTYTLFETKRLGIEWAEPVENAGVAEPGAVISVTDSFFEVRCLPGSLRVLKVKPEGRKSMSVHDFLLGKKLREGVLFR